MDFSEKLIRLRKQHGMSQEQLADRLNITRQSVSKWESGGTVPELSKLIALSEMFDVSIDYLVKDYIEEERPAGLRDDYGNRSEDAKRLEEKVDSLARYVRGYQYTSKTKIAGIPLVCIRLSRRMGKEGVAKGIIAVGNVAIGVLSFGCFSVGIVSVGAAAAGVAALGAAALGILVLGAFAVGIFALGSAAVGIYAFGASAVGKEIAVGAAAFGDTAIGESVQGVHCLKVTGAVKAREVEEFIMTYHPGLWPPVMKFIKMFTSAF